MLHSLAICTAANNSTHAARLQTTRRLPACMLACYLTNNNHTRSADDVLDANNLKKLFASDRVEQIMSMADKNKASV
jgi:hypothetical protein